ncbi:aminotransferase class I/II-fold pyridoxal phosphate-dependent enzyme [Streptomyces sp. NPDC020125]|uniref:aminotransferase class I/II-fold pyridoxal phosphate-dependent enzyme n=1 Tax=Streptomyces sp. NPDC020125 TaxID=3154593 RepID=UPI0033E285AF
MDRRTELRRCAGLTHHLRPRPADEPVLDLAGNDYLGLVGHPRVVRAATEAVVRWGGGATGSRLVTGTTLLHQELEEERAAFCGFAAALVFSCGYPADLAALTALTGPGTLIVFDAYNHASLVDGCRLSRTKVRQVPHREPGAVRTALTERGGGRALVVTDSVFSVHGDAAPLTELAQACRAHGAAPLTDDAHGPGVVGDFDTGLAPASVGGALGALRLLHEEPERAAQAREVARRLSTGLAAAGLEASVPDTAVATSPGDPVAHHSGWATASSRSRTAASRLSPGSAPRSAFTAATEVRSPEKPTSASRERTQ